MAGSTRGTADDIDMTGLLSAWTGGNRQALEQLVPYLERELRKIARPYLARHGASHTLQTTDLLNEAYIRLIPATGTTWRDRTHFFATAAKIMRRILIDYARRRRYAKRGGGAVQISLDEAPPIAADRTADLLAIDDALLALSRLDPRKAQVVELRFFGGLTVQQAAEVLNISPESVARDWRLAKLWLVRELSAGCGSDAVASS